MQILAPPTKSAIGGRGGVLIYATDLPDLGDWERRLVE